MVLLQNARWFTRIRWVVVAVLFAFGAISAWFPHLLIPLDVRPPRAWPWMLGGLLVVFNLLFVFLLRRLKENVARTVIGANIWFQIVVDLVILTVLVHLVGSTETYIPFAYLFHIVLACIFFAPFTSFLVTFMAAALYLCCVVMEVFGALPHRTIFGIESVQQQGPALSYMLALSATFTWLVVWYLVSHISGALRRRDRELAAANERLIRADQEKNMQVLRTTHDLKAPFSGIESNIQILRLEHWNDIPASVQSIIDRIEHRSATLRERIRDILLLGELRSPARTEENAVSKRFELKPMLQAVVRDLDGKARQQKVQVVLSDANAVVQSDERQLRILFSNLIANAIIYSREGGTVEVTVHGGARKRVSIADHGIGIAPDALPRIFEEYFRTKEASRINRNSTGLGLAIVARVAENLGLTIDVRSEKGQGTTFDVTIPESG